MTLHIHRSQHADRLAGALAGMLLVPPADVFAREILVVPARGIERWLTQRLSHRLGTGTGAGDGICAGVEFVQPWQLTRQVLGLSLPDTWAPDRLAWPLWQVIEDALTEPWLKTVATHLGSGSSAAEDVHRRGRGFAVARRLAGLFNAYANYRPSMLAAWALGDDTDGYGKAIPADLQWQPELWRRVRDRVEAADPVTQLDNWQRELAAGTLQTQLPERISYFGPTRMTARDLQIIATLSRYREVHLWLPHPSPDLWRRLSFAADARDVTDGWDVKSSTDGWDVKNGGYTRVLDRRRSDPTILFPRNRLLSALGRDSRELQLAIGAVDADAVRESAEVGEPGFDTSTAVNTSPGNGPERKMTLLSQLQTSIAQDRSVDQNTALMIDSNDRSIQVHACHGPIRQVEVLREVIVGLLADDQTLQPRDILVMCPDIDLYTPLIAATFGLGETVPNAHPGQQLRVSVADRSVARTNPILAMLQRVLTLVDGRATATDILDLATMPPVRRRFGFTADDLEQLGRWTTQAAVKWGLDTRHRSVFSMDGIVQGTWRSGLDRILLGVAMADEGDNWLSVALPVDDVGSSDIELAGRFADFVDRVTAAVRSLTGEQGIGDWARLLGSAVHDLADVSESDQWQLDQTLGLLADIVEEAGDFAESMTMTVADLRQLLAGRLGAKPTRGNFRTGGLTFCTMVPMRSVPQRVICLLGLDDGVFPRAARRDGDDILAREPVVGERDIRGEDRQLMLDALLAAQDVVAIVYSGSDERTGVDRPPAVPVGELLDTLDEIAITGTGSRVREQILRHHPLQPFDQRNFELPRPFSFDRQAFLATTAGGHPEPSPGFLSSPLPPLPARDVDLAKMVRLLQYPARGFLEQRLQVSEPVDTEPISNADQLPVELDPLQRWEIGRRLLAGRMAGESVATCRQAEYRRGLLPPGPLGTAILDEILGEVQTLVQACAELRTEQERSIFVTVDLANTPNTAGREIRGTLTCTQDAILTVTYSKISALHRLRTWIELLALTVARPELKPRGITIGRGSTGRAQQFTIEPLLPNVAAQYLNQLVELFDVGLREPLPMAARTSCSYAADRHGGSGVADAEQTAAQHWTSGRFPGENAEPSHVRIWGSDAPFSQLLATASADHSDDNPAEPTLFGELAMRVWLPLLQREQVQWL